VSAQPEQSVEHATPPIGWCPMCQQDVAAWVPGPNGRANAQCPYCDSLERNRLLILALDRLTDVFATATTLLDVAPTPGVDAALVRKVGEDRYVGFDLGIDSRDVKVLGDLTRLPFQDRSVDVLVAFHVLEHIPDDAAAMREICRVLGDTGIGLVQVPMAAGPTDEDPNASIEERIQRFGRHDHVRQYGDDWEDRLRAAGLGVARFLAGSEFTPDELRRANTHGRFWLVTGVADDSGAPAAMISAVIERRRAVGLDPAEAVLPSADARARDSELRVMRRELETTQRAFRQMRRRARRAEADLAAVRSGPVARIRTMVSRAIDIVREGRVRNVARDPGRLVRRLRG
jgi:SAM-dependent methyltransferase